MTNGHVYLANIISVLEINPLAMVFQSKTVKPLNTVSGYSSICGYIFCRLKLTRTVLLDNHMTAPTTPVF